MTINEFHQRIITLKRQGQGGYHTREEIDRWLNDASNDKYNEEKRLFERDGYISDNLGNFKTSDVRALTAGFGALPTDYDYRTNASTTSGLKVEIVPIGEWIERINDPIDVPSATRPICLLSDEIEVRPTSLSAITLYYLKRPATMVFGYTTDAEGNTIYDAGTSTQCNWPISCHVDILLRALGYAGVPLTDDLMMKLKMFKKQTENV